MDLIDTLLGRKLASSEQEEQKIGVVTGIPAFGLDGLSSAAYGPEAAMAVLVPLGIVGLRYVFPVMVVILILLGLLYLSYRQTIAAYPGAGGSYTVARENLGERPGLLAGAALLVDYILNVAVGISAGIGALVSALPRLQPYTLSLCLATLVVITVVNLRGTRETGFVFGFPTYLFVGSLATVVTMGLVKVALAGGHPQPAEPLPAMAPPIAAASLWIVMRAFASGCTAMTGVEAVSNGVSAFAEPRVKNAQRTLSAIVFILVLLLAGIAFLARAYGIGAMDQERPGYQSVLSQLVVAVFGRGLLYDVTMGSVLTILCFSANTSFADFPRLCRLMALDHYLPQSFAAVGRRLVYTGGILVLAVVSGILLAALGGITDRLIPLFAIGAFTAFTLSQAGMVQHWRRLGGARSWAPLLVNAIGASATGCALAVIVAAKFTEGAWITVLLIPGLVFFFIGVHAHYARVERDIACDRPVNTRLEEPPIVVIPVDEWTSIAERALRFGMAISKDVIAVHVAIDEEHGREVEKNWRQMVQEPLRAAGDPVPRLVVVPSPYRQLFGPLLEFIDQLKTERSQTIAVVIPELVQHHWYDYWLHNHRAMVLKALLLLRGADRVVVANVPWHLR
jgi:amino acid transporter